MVADDNGKRSLRIDVLTREYPPDVYGGAGVHAEYLAKYLAPLVEYTSGVSADHEPLATANRRRPATPSPPTWPVRTRPCAPSEWMSRSLPDRRRRPGPQPYLVREPRRPPGQTRVRCAARRHHSQPGAVAALEGGAVGGGYALSSWCERTAIEAADAVIAVSAGMARDLRAAYPAVDPERVVVVHNGIDTQQYHRITAPTSLPGTASTRTGQALCTSVASPARRASHTCCEPSGRCRPPRSSAAGRRPDTPEIAAEVEGLVAELRSSRDGIVSIQQMLANFLGPDPDARFGIRVPVDLRAGWAS